MAASQGPSPKRKAFVKKAQVFRQGSDNKIVPRHVARLRRSALTITAAVVAGAAACIGVVAPTGSAIALDGDDWLGTVNAYRAMSGLAPVVEVPEWSEQGRAHSCYMLQNDIAHDEIPGRPGYTPGGDLAGNNGNVAVSGSVAANARSHIDLWMTGPFHAIGILRHNLARSGYGECEDEAAPRWRSGATLDVVRGVDLSIPRPAQPTVFPGNGATVGVNRFVVESPDPLAMCGWTGVRAGLPLIALMPNDVTWANATLTGPSGPIETCVLTEANTSGVAQQILAGDNAVVVMPSQVLADGTYTATVTSSGGAISWAFTVQLGAPLDGTPPPPPAPAPETAPAGAAVAFEANAPYRLLDTRSTPGMTRLRGGSVYRFDVATPDTTAISANFVAVDPSAAGYLSAFNCTPDVPTVSLLGYAPGQTIANQAVVPLASGDVCVFSSADTDLVIDVNGSYTGSDGSGFVPIVPLRLYDSDATTRLAPHEERVITVAGSGAPLGTPAVALNVTAVQPDGYGYVQVYPCGAPTAAEISTINYAPGDFRPNSVVTPLDDSGRVCVRSLVATDVIVDITGHFATDGLEFQALSPARMFDSRATGDLNPITSGARAGTGQVLRIPIAGVRGVPDGADAVSVNLTATDATAGTFLTAYPCGRRPDSSNVNITPDQAAAANGAIVQLSPDGELCVYTLNPVHVIVDVNGVWL